MVRLTNFNVPLGYTADSLKSSIEKKLNILAGELIEYTIVRRSIDARKKNEIHYVMTVDIVLAHESDMLKTRKDLIPTPSVPEIVIPTRSLSLPPIVVGAGPAGLFSALILARAGCKPVLIERGKSVENRSRDVAAMEKEGKLLPDSNVQFGEGGAGAFSDGKLTCGVKSPYLPFVLETFVRHGAPPEILFDQMPHIGTDRLKSVVSSIRNEILSLGGSVMFETKLIGLMTQNSEIRGVRIRQSDSENEIMTNHVLLCIGHSARDTFRMLFDENISMLPKPFAIGVRIEHPRDLIDRSQYGIYANRGVLGAASYKLVAHTPDRRGVYTFCMCPGGHVIAAASEPGGVVTNGMSYHARNAQNSNAALLVGIKPEDFGSDHPLAGFQFQRKIEEAAYLAANSSRYASPDYLAPAQRVEDFLHDRETKSFGNVSPSYQPGVVPADLRSLLPAYVTENLKFGIRSMDRQLHGFAMPDSVLTAPETRSSSPVRIVRNERRMSDNIRGLYPVGEGAGYAGGIVSAALDGITTALAILNE